ncbi:class I SAM-dependent methyltransferase [Miltoncostaea marina]|uniref:class I SAM-dependent methyltransferase n=1 Tax=Miltoncostaea marina TaxID=2843215 RepID=UPI001C3D46A2|nr:class I SAM-dependent methyltransferase [Miltoncostaea marina]
MDELESVRAAQRAMWGAGDFTPFAARIRPVGARLVRAVGAGPGTELLDVGCGTGNVAIQAAQAGARVTGVDLAPEMLARARAQAEAAGVEVAWVEGDAEDLPVADRSVDAVVSSFGCMFAPRHEVAAAEIARVLRPGGRMAVAAWRPDGAIAAFMRVGAAHMPPPPASASPPVLWGDEAHVREIFAGTGVDLGFEDGHVDMVFASAGDAVREHLTGFGPLLAARRVLEPEGRWQALADDVAAFFARLPAREGGEVAMPGDYVVITGRAPG